MKSDPVISGSQVCLNCSSKGVPLRKIQASRVRAHINFTSPGNTNKGSYFKAPHGKQKGTLKKQKTKKKGNEAIQEV